MIKAPIYHIVGGGLSGVACAYFLKKYNPQAYSVVYEARPYLGGRSHSQFDDEWNINLNNYLHTICKSDHYMSQFVSDTEWRHNIFFVNMKDMSGSSSLPDNLDIVRNKICNCRDSDIAPQISKYLNKKFDNRHLKNQGFFAFNQDFTQRVINVYAAYANELHCGCRLSKLNIRQNNVTSLYFGNRKVKLNQDDKIILAMDNASTAKFLGLTPLPANSSVDIAYYTSQTIFLPQGVSFVGMRNGVANWLYSASNIISAQICDYQHQFTTLDKLALYVWDEISRIRGVNSAFIPSYRINENADATLLHTAQVNSMRPQSASTKYDNVFICGDWTMKNYPCTLETAVLSARRAVKTSLKQRIKK